VRCNHPDRVGIIGEITDRIHQVGAVAKQHRAPPAHMCDNARQPTDLVMVPHRLAHGLIDRDKAARMVDGHFGARAFDGLDNAIRIF
jgi:hypothetical protein